MSCFANGYFNWPSLLSRRLANNTCANARQHLPSALSDRLAAIVTMFGARADRHIRPSTKQRVLNRVVDLVLHRTIARPATSQFAPPSIYADILIYRYPRRHFQRSDTSIEQPKHCACLNILRIYRNVRRHSHEVNGASRQTHSRSEPLISDQYPGKG